MDTFLRHKRIDRLVVIAMASLALFWLSSFASDYLAVAPQSDAKDQFYSIVYYITLN
jgi:hypothetical protein